MADAINILYCKHQKLSVEQREKKGDLKAHKLKMKVGQTVMKLKFYWRRGEDKPSSPKNTLVDYFWIHEKAQKSYLDLFRENCKIIERMRKFWSATFHENYFSNFSCF